MALDASSHSVGDTIPGAAPGQATRRPSRKNSKDRETSGIDAYNIIRTCLSHRSEAERREEVRAFIEASPDWDVVCREATRHGVRPLFFQRLERLFRGRLPSSLRNQMQKSRRADRIQATFLTQELCKIVRLCEENSLPVLALKGPMLAQVAYGDIAMRRYVDLDVLIPRGRFSELDRLLKDEGYKYPERRSKITGWRRSLAHALSGQWQFTRAGGAFHLDVHTRVMPPGYSLPAAFGPFWERSRTIRLDDDCGVRGFAPEDMALILAYHGVKNQWRSLKYVVDLAELIRAEPALDWSALIERARRERATRVLRLGLLLIRDLLDVSLPAEVQKWTRTEPLDEVLAMMKSYLRDREQKSTLSYRKRVRLQLATKDTVAGQIRYGAYSALQHLWSAVLKP